jgi:hypothetical protein
VNFQKEEGGGEIMGQVVVETLEVIGDFGKPGGGVDEVK